MTNKSSRGDSRERRETVRLPLWAGAAIVVLSAGVVVLLGLLAVSIMERRWEAQRPAIVVRPLAQWEPNNARWGENYPREYETYLKTRIGDTRTRYGGAVLRDYLDEDPYKVILYAGYGFSKDYRQARGHYHAVKDIIETKRIKRPFNAGTCWTCKSTDVPRLMNKMGVREFYAANWHDLKQEVVNSIGCQDCHDPQTMNLRITRPALKEAFAAMGADTSEAGHQQMRSLVCAQCHVEYYFAGDESKGLKNYLVFPWEKGTGVEDMIAYYDGLDFADYVHPVSGTRIIKAQHPDYEMYLTGIHAYRGVSCADCHMPYRTEGGLKFTDHHVQSPLLNISGSCAVCHRWSEQEIRDRAGSIQTKVRAAVLAAEEALVLAHFDTAAAVQAGAGAEELAEARRLLRHGQFRWDYVSSNNGMGFHSPQESMRILGQSVNQAQQARILVARILAAKGVSASPRYPELATRAQAWEVAQSFVEGAGIGLLP
ncbi:MAG: ammonia-forming cytochrome c nitrite reductase subunit c552 [Phycisphaerales bacterium]|nr:MAG: ammonia-forming cytochrome c nitrite reductase subunit c552 [Phycisphaerales bacterium]